MSSSVLEQVVAGRSPGVVPLTVEQYHRMIELGILREGEPTELIDGILVRKDRADRGGNPMAHGPRHALTLKLAGRLLRPVEDWGYHLHSQLPVTLAVFQEPEPDLAVVRGRPEDYMSHHPLPADIRAIMEVSDSTLDYDRTTKQRLYATAGIAVYWIVNLVDGRVEVYEEPIPTEGRYAGHTDYAPGQVLPFVISASQQIELHVSQLFPA
jgi:Uma2 family endonuclease